MRNKLINKLICCSLTVVFTVGMLAGCGNTDTGKKDTQGSLNSQEVTGSTVESSEEAAGDTALENDQEAVSVYPIDTDETLTLGIVSQSKVTANYANLSETPWFDKLQERVGVEIEVMEMDSNAYKLLLMSGDLPDMVWGSTSHLPGGASAAIEDKIILPLTDYLDEYMPNYKAMLEENNEMKKIASTKSGEIFGAVMVTEDVSMTMTGGIIVRKDWLDKLGLEVPATLDEFYDTLVAFKEELGADAPLSCTLSDLKDGYLRYGITDAFGLVSTTFYQIDGEVHYGYAEAELKEVYEFMHKLYEEGLLDPEFATLDSATVKSNIMTGRTGFIYGQTSITETYVNEMKDTDPEFALTAMASLGSEEGALARGGAGNGSISKGYSGCITSSCEHPEIAAMVLDYAYSEEGGMFWNMGEEGVAWEYNEEGNPAFTELLTANPNGWAYTNAAAAYAYGGLVGPFVQSLEYWKATLSTSEIKLKTWETFAENQWKDYTAYSMATMGLPDEYADEYNKISSEISTYIDEMMVAYITGTKSLDTFESEYLATLKSLGVDRMIEIYQIVYDEYTK